VLRYARIRRKGQLLLLAGILALAGPALAAPWTLRLAPAVTVPAGPVRLADVARDPPPPEAADLLVCEGGRPGSVAVVDRRLVLRRLAAAHLAAGVRLAGPAECRVSFQGKPVSAEALRAWLLEALTPWIPAAEPSAPPAWLELDVAPPRAPVGDGARFELVEPRPLKAGRNLVALRIKEGGGALKLTAMVRCHLFGEVARARQPLPAGTELSPEQFAWEWQDLATAEHGLAVGRPALTGRSARRDVAAGASLREADLRETPLIRQGQPLELQLQRGLVSVTVPATARQEGRLGQVITVRNDINGRLIPARVVGPDRVAWGR
jgi:flagella basal body P-ring formation protein FlgA